jgi:hypothetical protein
MSTNGSNDVPRTIRFYDRDVPALEAGDYTIAVTQSVNSTDAATPLSKTFTANRNFSVVAPRFALPPSGVQTVFPPGAASGIFDQNLPHVVLTEPLLPWERLITDGDATAKGTPWMALLLFTEGDPEIQIIPPTVQPPQTPSQTLAGSYTIAPDPNDKTKLVLAPSDPATLGPAIEPEVGDATTCYAIDISTDTFTALTPRYAELPYLAHARDVEPVMPLKVTEIAVQDGLFSVVIGNRFPKAPPAGSLTGIKHIAHLVSLEGFAPYLVDAPVWPAGITRVRLVSLLSWTFTTMPEVGNFRELMLHLIAPPVAPGGDGLRLRMNLAPNNAPAPTPGSPAALVQQAVGQGFTALEYDTRAGDQTFAWYHGPFVPHPVAPFAANTPFQSAAAATIYDDVTGTFDLSYAAGWELGRLLALSDGAYVADKLKSQRSLRTAVNLVRERTRWTNAGRQLMAAASTENAAHLHALAEPSQPRRAFATWLAAALPTLLPKPGVPARVPPELAVHPLLTATRQSAPTSVQTLQARLDVQSFVRNRALTEIDGGGHASGVVTTMQSLRLLENVPFVHLVPDARMLPAESIRFFYVDPNYLDALCDGASSVGIQSSRDAQQQTIVRSVVRGAAIARAHASRATLIGRPQLLAGAQPGDPVAGFILRSSVVSGWPGLEVKAYSDLAGTNQIQPVRMDRTLAPDVMLCLYPQVPVRIEFDEPKEGLAFGVEDDALVYLRYIDDSGGNPTGKVIPGKTETLDGTYQRGTTRVVNIGTWQALLAEQFSTSPTAWGPAAFAIQMVRAPEQMLFEYQNG